MSWNGCLVVDNAPGVWHHAVVVIGKAVIASPGGAKAVTHHLYTLLATFLELLADVIGPQSSQCNLRSALRHNPEFTQFMKHVSFLKVRYTNSGCVRNLAANAPTMQQSNMRVGVMCKAVLQPD